MVDGQRILNDGPSLVRSIMRTILFVGYATASYGSASQQTSMQMGESKVTI